MKVRTLKLRNKHWLCSVYEKLQATRVKVAPVNLIYLSHFSATEATYKVSQNVGNFVEFNKNMYKNYTEASLSIKHIYIVVYTFSPFQTVTNSYSFSMSHIEYYHIALSGVSRIEF